MSKIKTFYLKFLRLFRNKKRVIIGGKSKVFVNGEEVRFDKGDTIVLHPPKIDRIDVLGKFEVEEIIPPEIKVTLIKGPK